jgi:lipopolysaccharide export system protein LptA
MNPTFHSLDPARPAAPLLAMVLALLLAAPLALLSMPAHAERADRDKPLNVEADNLSYDDLKQVNIFTGHVILTKGTIIIKADRVEVHQDPQGYQYSKAFSDGSPLAYFRQKRDVGDEYIQGNALRIDYDGKNDVTVLTGKALVQRLQGTALVVDEVHGDVITYDGHTDFYTATAGKTMVGPGNSSGRVHAMLLPQSAASAPVGASGATPLMASPKIDGAPQ